MRLLRTLAPLLLLASLSGVVSACGSGSSSGPAAQGGSSTTTGGSVATSGLLEFRPVYARFATGVALGPGVPKDLQAAMSSQTCPMKPQALQGMVMECDPGKTVFLLQDPLVSGHVTNADVRQIGHKNLYFLKLTLDPTDVTSLDSRVATMSGTELAFCYGGSVLTSIIIESNFDASHLTITGTYTKAQATKLAGQLTAS